MQARIKGYKCYEPPLRPEARSCEGRDTENLVACDEVTWRSRDGSWGSKTVNQGSVGT